MKVDTETKGESLAREGGLGHCGVPLFGYRAEERNQERRGRRCGNGERGRNQNKMPSWKPREVRVSVRRGKNLQWDK